VNLWLIILALWLAPAFIVGGLLLWHTTRRDPDRSHANLRGGHDFPPGK
jgi:hypothetical protein